MEKREQNNIKSPINFRAFLVVAAAVVGAILCAYVFMLARIVGMVIGIIYLLFLLALAVLYIVKFKIGRTPLRKLLTFAIAFTFAASAFSFAAAYSDFRAASLEMSGERYIVGRVCAADVRDGNYVLVLDDLVFDGAKIDGRLKVNITAVSDNRADFVDVGDKIFFTTNVKGIPLISGMSVNGSSFRTGIIYSCSVRGDAFGFELGKPTPIEKLLSDLKSILTKNMGDRYGNIAYSMITGDKYGLSSDVSSSFSAAGLGHILAVSGLHIGFIVFILGLVLSRTNKYVRFSVTTAFLIAYTVIADFSPSVIRAAVMATISGFSVFVSGRRDLLSSLTCAFSCILAFRPLYLFEAGFIMSFGAIFGIAVFGGSVARALSSRGVPHKISDSVSASLSVQAGILPAQTYFFGTVQPLSILVNLFLLPYLGVVFIAILVCLPIAAIPHLGGALGWCRYLLMPIDYLAQGISAIPFSNLALKSSCSAFLCYPIMFCMSDFFMMPKSKTVLIIFSAILCVALCLL